MGDDALARFKARPERYAEIVERLGGRSRASLLALLDETYARTEWLGDCARIRCPVQVIAGSLDHFPTVTMSRRVAEIIPDGRLHVVEGGSHFPNRSHRAEVQQVIGRFLSEILPGWGEVPRERPADV
jgi:pimeloyl-ACP methyl ester carboxylesterase